MPVATKVQLTGGGFQDSEGNLLVDGYLEMKLSQDGRIVGVGNIAAGITIRIQLDSNGDVVASPAQSVWGNDQMLPINSYYRVTGFTAEGQPAWGPNNQQVFGSGGTFDLDTWIPNKVLSWFPSLQSTELQVNGVDNVDQALLNLIDSATVTFTDHGDGSVSADAAVPPAISLETNSTPNTAQNVLNLEDTDTVTWENPSGGVVKAHAVTPAPPFRRSITFSANASGTTQWQGQGISAESYIYLQSGFGGAIQFESPYDDALGCSLAICGDSYQEGQLFETGGTTNWNSRLSDAPILLANLTKWETRMRFGTRYLASWLPNIRVPSGTVLQDSGNYYIQTVNDAQTGTTIPTFNTTPGNSTTDNTGTVPFLGNASWRCIGTTRPTTRGHHWVGLNDYNGTVGGSGYSQIMLVKGWDFPSYPPSYINNRPANFVGFNVEPAFTGVSTIHVYVGGETIAPVRFDTGIEPAEDGSFMKFNIIRVGNSLTFYIDDVLVYTSGDISTLTRTFYSFITGDNSGFNSPYNGQRVASTAYGKGTMVFDSGVYWVAVTTGTTSSGSNPLTGLSPTPGQIVVDGGITWQTQCPSSGSLSREPAFGIAINYILWE